MIYFPISHSQYIHNSRIVGVIVTRKTYPPAPPPKKTQHLTNKQKTTTANYNWILTIY